MTAARDRARSRFGLAPLGASALPDTESPRLAAKRLRRRIKRFLELCIGRDVCAETGCRSPVRFWTGHCDVHSPANRTRRWLSAEVYEAAWVEFFSLASDEGLGERVTAGEREASKALAAFPSVQWNRFGGAAGLGDDDADGDSDAEPTLSAAELGNRIANYAALFADQEDDDA